jgi:hypothetical protein
LWSSQQEFITSLGWPLIGCFILLNCLKSSIIMAFGSAPTPNGDTRGALLHVWRSWNHFNVRRWSNYSLRILPQSQNTLRFFIFKHLVWLFVLFKIFV